jgi:hypothetical protein
MCVLMARSSVTTEELSEVEAAIERAFSAIAESHPKGVRSAPRKAGDCATLVALLELESGLGGRRREFGDPRDPDVVVGKGKDAMEIHSVS